MDDGGGVPWYKVVYYSSVINMLPPNISICMCVFAKSRPKNVTNCFASMYHVYHVYHVPYVSYVTNVFVYSHICPGICPKNVTNFCVFSTFVPKM